jgi:hypothetical protein
MEATHMSELKSITVIFDDRTGCEGWYARAVESINGNTQERDIPLDCEANADDDDLADEARREVRLDALLSCDVADDFPVQVKR